MFLIRLETTKTYMGSIENVVEDETHTHTPHPQILLQKIRDLGG